MRDSKRFLRPDAVEQAARLDLKARSIVEGFLAGLHRSPYFGQSLEFRQHREYTVGDDLRHVDWKVWARQDRMYVKQYEEDTNLRCFLLVDVSRSMQYGESDRQKFEFAGTLASCFAYLALRQHDSVGCLTFADELQQLVPAHGAAHLLTIAAALTQVSLNDKTDMQPVLRRAVESVPFRGLVLVFTDGFAPRETWWPGLRILRERGHDVAVFHVLHDDEISFEFAGPTRFDDLESTASLTCNPRALRDGYLAAFQSFLHDWRHGCGRLRVDYTVVKTSERLDAVLASFLAKRQRTR